MSIRANKPAADSDATSMLTQAASDLELAEGNNFCVASPDKPLKRQLVVSIRASLNDLCLQKQKATWAPSADALKSIFQQKKFVSLDGSADAQGDLKSVVLHDLSVHAVSSTFPVSLGAKITGVDDQTFSSNGEAYSMIVSNRTAVDCFHCFLLTRFCGAGAAQVQLGQRALAAGRRRVACLRLRQEVVLSCHLLTHFPTCFSHCSTACAVRATLATVTSCIQTQLHGTSTHATSVLTDLADKGIHEATAASHSTTHALRY